MKHSLLNACVALVLACNYFAFQVELFDGEYEQNHPSAPTTLSISTLSTNWESFDKENAPQAFQVDADLHLECLLILQPMHVLESPEKPPSQLIRDKSPPSFSLASEG